MEIGILSSDQRRFGHVLEIPSLLELVNDKRHPADFR